MIAVVAAAALGEVVQVSSRGQQQPDDQPRSATFVNLMSTGACNLYWIGESADSGPRIFYGPVAAGGGERTVEAFPGNVFSLVNAGTYHTLAEFTISASADENSNHFKLTDAMANSAQWPRDAPASAHRESSSAACRSATSCGECTALAACGWSVVRRECFVSHPVATATDPIECVHLPAAPSKSVEAWLNQATGLVLGREGHDPRALRAAFRALERGVEAAAEAATAAADTPAAKAAGAALSKANGALSELRPKLEAVFDERDALELLAASRHPALAALHPVMPPVERRTAAEARAFIARGEPVVITDLFGGADAASSPVAHKWTMEYLNRRAFGAGQAADIPAALSRAAASSDEQVAAAAQKTIKESEERDGAPPTFNVAADVEGGCCRYFEPRLAAHKADYPYPFAPSTHLYRDQFGSFVRTVRASRLSRRKGPRVLHYLHEIVMNAKGEAVVAGGPAPPALAADLAAMTTSLQPLASHQPFFGGFASAKVWMGQRGVVMPMHYDATDNLYAMAWGRKRAILGAPGQLDALYRYPNAHPLVGSSQVNLSAPDLSKYPRFEHAKLREVIVGVGDVLYLPGWWWHQFEQPFEETASLNVWSREREGAPDPSMRDLRTREHALSDSLEAAAARQFGAETGVVLDALAHLEGAPLDDVPQRADESYDEAISRARGLQANRTLLAAADEWRSQVRRLPGGHPKAAQPASELVAEYLELTHRHVVNEGRWAAWKPGVGWDLSRIARLPRALRERCESTKPPNLFMSECGL